MADAISLRALEGCKRLVFDGAAWALTGDVGDNSCFYKPATIIKVRREDGEWVADVLFDHDTRISRGHFLADSGRLVYDR